jgi:hypothetical protein
MELLEPLVFPVDLRNWPKNQRPKNALAKHDSQ